jgi:hypothetical protein
VASGGLGDRHGGRGYPARSSSKGTTRERASLREMGRGSECRCGRCSKGTSSSPTDLGVPQVRPRLRLPQQTFGGFHASALRNYRVGWCSHPKSSPSPAYKYLRSHPRPIGPAHPSLAPCHRRRVGSMTASMDLRVWGRLGHKD